MSSTTSTPPRRPLTGRKLWTFRLIMGLFSLVLALGTAELAARVLRLAPPVYPEADTAIVLYYTDPNGLIKLTPGWKGYVGYVWTEVNSQGFRDHTYAPEPPPGTLRVVMLGDSYTMGDAVTLEDTYTKKLEALLREKHPNVEVLNCGVSATNTGNQLEILKEVLRDFRPHLVVLSYNLNDFQWYKETRFDRLTQAGQSLTVQPDGRVTVTRDYSLPQRVKLAVRGNSYLYRWLANVWDSWARQQHPETDYDERARVQSWIDAGGHVKSFERLGQIKELCEQRCIPFGVVILPAILNTARSVESMDDYPYGKEHDLIHEQMKALGVEYADLLPAFAGQKMRDLWAHPFDRHYSADGNGIIARECLKYLEPKVAALEKKRAGQ